MPPRISPCRVSTPSPCQCFRTRPRSSAEHLVQPLTRPFHSTVHRDATKLRRDMWDWLQGPGKAFRDPLPGSTNYMSAYDRSGNLTRNKDRYRGSEGEDAAEADEAVVSIEEEDAIQEQEFVDGVTETLRRARFAARQAARDRKAEIDARGGLPRERRRDLHPYPLNHHFYSQSVLSEDLREEVYRQVVTRGIDISTVSAAFGIDTRRVAAVVRLKTLEKQWVDEGKTLAKPYNEAVMAMIPQTPFKPNDPKQQIFPHESINDLPVHPRTRQQIFYPVSESRQFTREDAARVFDDNLMPADKRIPHPELIVLEKEHMEGFTREERWSRQLERDEKARKSKIERDEKRRQWEQRTQRIVPGRRWDFQFQDISAEQTGKDGRARSAVGIRYGMPHEDRKRGMVKIPTSVE